MVTGNKYHKLTALNRSKKKSGNGNYYWWFRCDCGTVKEILPSNVVKIHAGVVSCGCTQKARQHGKAWLSQMIYDYVKHAEKLKLTYGLTRDQFEQLTSEPCRYCGEPPRNGIDRLDSSLGYIEANCVPCCKVCNYMKRKMSVMEFIEHTRKVVYMTFVSSIASLV